MYTWARAMVCRSPSLTCDAFPSSGKPRQNDEPNWLGSMRSLSLAQPRFTASFPPRFHWLAALPIMVRQKDKSPALRTTVSTSLEFRRRMRSTCAENSQDQRRYDIARIGPRFDLQCAPLKSVTMDAPANRVWETILPRAVFQRKI